MRVLVLCAAGACPPVSPSGLATPSGSVKNIGPAFTADETRRDRGAAMDLSILPLSLKLPSGYRSSSGTQGAVPSDVPSSSDATPAGAAANVKSAGLVDVISISNNAFVAGNFTAVAGDTYWLSNLFKASTPIAQTIAGFQVALGNSGVNGGMLRLDGQDVPDGTSVSTEQFARLTYTTGAGGSQTIVVVAQIGARQPGLPDGSLGAPSREADSPAVQITAHVTGSRSINAMGALTTSTGTDVGIAGIVQQAGIFTGWTGWLGGTTKLDTARFDDLTYTTGANGRRTLWWSPRSVRASRAVPTPRSASCVEYFASSRFAY
jgi:hypothetical protein